MCIQKSTEKYITFPVPIKKKIKTKKGIIETITWLRFIDSSIFISSLLSNLVKIVDAILEKKQLKKQHYNLFVKTAINIMKESLIKTLERVW